MSFPIDITIPNAPNDPADDQPLMKQNYANIAGYLAVDHVAAGSPGDGFHKQVTYNSENIPGAVIDPKSISFTANAALLPSTTGSASTIAQEFYKNANGIFPTSSLKAFCTFTTALTPGPPTINNAFNIASITGFSGAPLSGYTITLTANAVIGNNIAIFIFSSDGGTWVYGAFANPTLTIASANSFLAGVHVNFLVLQI